MLAANWYSNQASKEDKVMNFRRSYIGSLGVAVMLSLSAFSLAAEYEVDISYSSAIATIENNTRVRSALDYAVELDSQSLSDLIELTEIPAPPFKEDARAARFADMLRESGLADVSIDAVGNAIGRRPGTVGDKTIAISAHLDTVFPEGTDVTVRYDGNRMLAPGIGDNSRGLVMILAVLRVLEYAQIETEADILFIGNVGEEGLGDLRGVKYLFRDGAEAIDSIIVIDGGEANRIVYGGVGSHRYRVTFKGPGGHSWGAFGLANPHHAIGRAIALFDAAAPSVTAEGEKTSYNIGRIGGGTSINSIPFESWMEVDMRSGSQTKLDEIDSVFQAAMERALLEENNGREGGPALSLDVERVGTRPAALADTNSRLVQQAIAATLAFGITPVLQISSTDSNLPISKGIPAVTMSRGGRGGNAHSPDEWWENVDSHISVQIGLLTLLAQAGLVD